MRFWEQTGETCMKSYKKIGTCFLKKKKRLAVQGMGQNIAQMHDSDSISRDKQLNIYPSV